MHRGPGGGWAHGPDGIGFIAMDEGELVLVDTMTKCGSYDTPQEEPDRERFERIAAAYLAGTEVEEGLTSIRYDIVRLLVASSEKALLRHQHNVLNERRQALERLPRAFGPKANSQSSFRSNTRRYGHFHLHCNLVIEL